MLDAIMYDSFGTQITYLVQWDVDQTVSFEGVNISTNTAPIVHFCNKNSDKALGVQSTLDDGVINVKIPNILLKEAETIVVYFYSNNRSVEITKIPVRPKPQPNDYFYSDNVEVVTLSELIAQVKSLDSTVTTNEVVRQNNESTRINSENKRIASESTREKNETVRVTAENSRSTAEKTRASNEDNRVATEKERNTNESARKLNEDARKKSEETRSSNESVRIENENARKLSENERISAENNRSSNESVRNDSENKRIAAEKTRVSNENTRQSNESTRQTTSAESLIHLTGCFLNEINPVGFVHALRAKCACGCAWIYFI